MTWCSLLKSAILCSSSSFDYSCDVDSKVIINVRVVFSTTDTEPQASCALENEQKIYFSLQKQSLVTTLNIVSIGRTGFSHLFFLCKTNTSKQQNLTGK